ncbi:GNAT family N-acetyltransferase [Fictibacillus iocasae]|uniref:GNAT family N-acetyltransferase n=1 Tax=Fictibacillus iocasae TaxID=2715437 RepID=A0ABW2NVV5_9BACL
MTTITIQKAELNDAAQLTTLKKAAFDEEARKWLTPGLIDYNIQPPGYASVEVAEYMIQELNYFKVIYDGLLSGGIIVTVTGRSYGRIDRIFIAPDFQGKGIGSRAMELIEQEFPEVLVWDLETSSRQKNNHHFYEKMGFRTTFETDDEFYYIKKKKNAESRSDLIEHTDLSSKQYENCNMTRSEGYQITMENSSFSNSNLSRLHVTNCNLSQSAFQNINFRNNLFADLNLSSSRFLHVTLGGVTFFGTNLGDQENPVSFEKCDLKGSKIVNCNLQNVELESCQMDGMKINNVPVEELLEAYNKVTK